MLACYDRLNGTVSRSEDVRVVYVAGINYSL